MPEDHPSAAVSRRVLVDAREGSHRRHRDPLGPRARTHPDDETFGCGATIARKRAAGSAVTVCVATDGRNFGILEPEELVRKRAENLRVASAILGIEPGGVEILGFEDGALPRLEGELVDRLTEVIARTNPDEIYIPSDIDGHADHRALYSAALVAIAKAGTTATVLSYPIWFWGTQTWLPKGKSRLRTSLQSRSGPLIAAVRLRPRIVRTGVYLDAKRRAMDVYSFELQRSGPHFERWFLRDEELFFEIAVNGRGR